MSRAFSIEELGQHEARLLLAIKTFEAARLPRARRRASRTSPRGPSWRSWDSMASPVFDYPPEELRAEVEGLA